MDSHSGGDDDYDPKAQATKRNRTAKLNKEVTNKRKRPLFVGRGTAPTITLERENLKELHTVGYTILDLDKTDKKFF